MTERHFLHEDAILERSNFDYLFAKYRDCIFPLMVKNKYIFRANLSVTEKMLNFVYNN